uniref:Uncharacterized protein n=1 Tax=Tetradesmus obliquus TaxID=3088 RepID=A0A383W850_TETOB
MNPGAEMSRCHHHQIINQATAFKHRWSSRQRGPCCIDFESLCNSHRKESSTSSKHARTSMSARQLQQPWLQQTACESAEILSVAGRPGKTYRKQQD